MTSQKATVDVRAIQLSNTVAVAVESGHTSEQVSRIVLDWWSAHMETEMEYRSAVVYENGDIRETGPTRRSTVAALADAEDEEPSLHRQKGEPKVLRAIVSRARPEPGPWSIVGVYR